MRLYISSDIEGAAGIVDWQQVRGPGSEYELGRRLLAAEVNAAIDGAVHAGAEHVLVNDSHGTMHNLDPRELHHRASYLSGRHKPMYMMEGLDAGFDAIFFIAYHGAVGSERAVLSHTYNPLAIWEARLNGVAVGESALNALVALHHRVPVALISGDQAAVEEARAFLPDAEAVVVKRSITRSAAESLHPERARELIRAAAQRAIARLSAARSPGGGVPAPDPSSIELPAIELPAIELPAIELPATIELTFLTADMAEMASWLAQVRRTGARTVAFTDESALALYRTFVTIVNLTRAIVER